MKFGYDEFNVLDEIVKANGDDLGFDFDLLGRLRGYGTDSRASTFNYDGTKRFGDYDADAEEWKRYHWCRSQLLGYEDDSNTYYIVPDREGSTKVIISSSAVVNRIEYDHLGRIRSQTTAPQVELLWRALNLINDIYYIDFFDLYAPEFGKILSTVATKAKSPNRFGQINSQIFKGRGFFESYSELFHTTIPIPRAPGIIGIGVLVYLIVTELECCGDALTEIDSLNDEWDNMYDYSSFEEREAYAATLGYGSYESWRRGWTKKASLASQNRYRCCRGVGI